MARVIGIDQGTTGTKALILDTGGDTEVIAAVEHRQLHPRPGWVEHDPEQLIASIERMLGSAGNLAAVGIANQGETVVAWDGQTGRPLCNAIVWQDERTRSAVDALKRDGAETLTLARAGLPLDPYFSASKLRWMLDNVDTVKAARRDGRLRLGTTDSFFLDRLAGVYATDVTTASRTSLMNLETRDWDPELCGLFGVPLDLLPPVRATTGAMGEIARGGRSLAIAASVVDQQAALFGHGARAAGQCKVTFGTGAFCLTVTGDRVVADPDAGLLPTVAWVLGDGEPTYALDGGVYNAASALNWVRSIGLFRDHDELEGFEGRSGIAGGLVFVPALSGLGCPYWDRSAAGMWLGIGLHTSRRDLCRAVLEGVALRACQVLRAMERLAGSRSDLSIDGGMSNNRYFCQFLANAAGREVTVPGEAELTALGTAQLALLGSGLAPDIDALPPGPPPRCIVTPSEPISDELHQRYSEAVERTRGWRAAAD